MPPLKPDNLEQRLENLIVDMFSLELHDSDFSSTNMTGWINIALKIDGVTFDHKLYVTPTYIY